MGGLVARYYLRYGGAEPGGPVTWAGARRISRLIVVATPNAGSIFSLNAVLHGNPVGMSNTTLAPRVVAHMPSIYQLMPPLEASPLVDHRGDPVGADLHSVETWRRFGWGPWSSEVESTDDERAYLDAVLSRARAFHEALARVPETASRTPVTAIGGDCLPTLGRAVVPEVPGQSPRFLARTPAEGEFMFDAGDGRVTRSSVLGTHLEHDGTRDTGIPEVSEVFFGDADHHGIYAEATFQSILLRRLLHPAPRPKAAASPNERRAPGPERDIELVE